MKRAAIIGALLLNACAPVSNYSPANVDYANVQIVSAEQAYALFMDSAYAAGVAATLSDDCPDFGYDVPEEEFLIALLEDRLETYFAANPDELASFLTRLTPDPTIRTIADLERDADVELSDEVNTEIFARVIDYFEARGRATAANDEAFACASADLEKQSGSLIGRFLFRE